MNPSDLSFFDKSVIKGIVIVMEDKTTFKKNLKPLIALLKKELPVKYRFNLPSTASHMALVLNNCKAELAARDIYTTRLNANGVKFDKISTTNSIEDKIMKTKTYKNTLKTELLEVFKDFGPATTAEMATLTNRSSDAIRATISVLRNEGHNISSRSTESGTRAQTYYIDHSAPLPTPTKAPEVGIPKSEPSVSPMPAPVCNNKATKDLINRAFYLMKALRKIDIDTLMDHLNLDETTATKVILALATEDRAGMKLDITLQDMG